MPQIDAPTVAEHRANQMSALLDAAEEVLLADGYDGLTFGAIGIRAGLARNSVYRYFESRDDVVAAVCERELPQWLSTITTAMDAEKALPGRVDAFVRTQFGLVSAGRHRLARVLQSAPLGPDVRRRINALAYEPAVLLQVELERHGDPAPELTAMLVQGLVNAAVRMHSVPDPEVVIERAVVLACRAVGAGD